MRVPFFPSSSPTFVVGGVLDGSYCNRSEVQSLCGFDVYFLYVLCLLFLLHFCPRHPQNFVLTHFPLEVSLES
jgi:hypothetical protein